MNKPVPLLRAALWRGGFWLCLLAGSCVAWAQTPEPAAASVEAPAVEEVPAAAATDTEILATQGATFTAKDRIAVFSGDVRVKDPRFTLACDKLTVYLNKGAEPGAAATPAATPSAVDPAAKGSDADRGSIDHAVAEGHVIIIQKRAPTKAGEEEKVSIGRADRAEYDGKTGDMTLRGMPKMEQNGDSHEALSNSTYMILGRDNNLKTFGPSRTYIAQRAKDNPPGAKPGSSPPAGSPAGRRPQQSGGMKN